MRFSAGLATLASVPNALGLELGRGRTLSALAQAQGVEVVASLGCDQPPQAAAMLRTLGQLWCRGVEVDWAGVHEGVARRRRPLPTYPFEARRHWLDAVGPPPAMSMNSGSPALEVVEDELVDSLGIRPIDSYPGLVEGLSELCASHVAAFLRGAGIELRAGVHHRVDEIPERIGVVAAHRRLIHAMLGVLAAEGAVDIRGELLECHARVESLPSPAEFQATLAERYPGFRGLLEFIGHCAASYPEALTGRVESISVLYPDGSSAQLDTFEQRTVEHRSERIYLGLVREAALRLLAEDPNRKLRVLEVGGGKGMLTWPLVEALVSAGRDRIDYHFTDLGKTFVDDACREAACRGLAERMSFARLDISRAPATQGYGARRFDLIVAYNVVHAVPDVPAALRYLAQLSAPGGTLALVEVVELHPWDVLTWGLAEGFWHFADSLRTDRALLSLDQWEAALGDAGFESVRTYPRTPARRARMDHGLVLGRARLGAVSSVDSPRSQPQPTTSSRAPRPPLATPYVAPRTILERKLASICEVLFGIEPVGVHDNFFELGADSLVTLRLAAMIRDELGYEVSPHAAFSGPTVERMVAGFAPSDQRARGVTLSPSSPLVPLQQAGTRPPFFFVHPVLGVAFPYIGLARELGPDQPFYGIQAFGLDGRTKPKLSLEDTAALYLDGVREVAPTGPYYIGGYSFGCSIAFEMAHQLTRAGETVAFLALVDGPAPTPAQRPTARGIAKLVSVDVLRTMLPHIHDYMYLSRGGGAKRGAGVRGFEALLARATIARFIPTDSKLLTLQQPALKPLFRTFIRHIRQARVYTPPPYSGPITFFKAVERNRSEVLDLTMGWDALAAGEFELHEIDAEHISLMRPPMVQRLAAKLSQCLIGAQEHQHESTRA